MKKMKITVVSPEQMQEEGFRSPAKFFIIDALGMAVFLHTRDRQEATQYVKDEYGGKYNIRTSSDEKVKGEVSCRGFANSRSRAGTSYKNILNKQIKGF